MMNFAVEINTLQCRLKAAQAKLNDFYTGRAYQEVLALREADARYYCRQLAMKELELSKAHAETVAIREQWFAVFEDTEKEHQKEIDSLKRKLAAMEQRALKAERDRDEALDHAKEYRRMYYETAAALEDSQGRNQKLLAQLNRDYENSSLPSSRNPNHKKISNNREHTGKKPGGQPGHKGHRRKKHEPTVPVVTLPTPEEITEDPGFKKTGREIIKQVVGIKVALSVTEYHADVYSNSSTGERIHAAFPEGAVDDVNYDGSIRAFLYLLNQHCCVSLDKCSEFLSFLTNGELVISKGMISGLVHSFAKKSEKELRTAFQEMLATPVMHTDYTNARVNAKTGQVLVCTTPDGKALYFSRDHKGHEGIKKTVVEDYQGILVHDHDKTFYRYGSGHQECLSHVSRYLKNSMENEPDRQWNTAMLSLIREMIHYRNSLPEGTDPDADQAAAYEKRYKEILALAAKEYEDIPASDYYREGYNLYRRMAEYMPAHLLFLHDLRVPATNNAAERKLRPIKRKLAQMMTFRSGSSLDDFCRSKSMLDLLRQQGGNLFDRVSVIFG